MQNGRGSRVQRVTIITGPYFRDASSAKLREIILDSYCKLQSRAEGTRFD